MTARSPHRHLLAPAALLAASALGLAACGGGSGASAGAAGGLAYASDSEPTCLDPNVSPQDVTARLMRNVYDSLVFQDPRGELHPWLATTWKAAPDLKSYTFTLREGVTFHDGTPLTAEAVKATFDRVVDPATKSQYAATLIGPYAGSTVIDDRTVKVSFKKPNAAFLQSASQTFLGITSPKADKRDYCAKPVGSGAYAVAGYVRGDNLTLRRHEPYRWGPSTAPGPAKEPKVTVRFLPEDSVRIGAITSGRAQIAAAVPPKRVAGLGGRVRIVRADLPGGTYSLHLNTSRAPFSDERLRRAFQKAVDTRQLVSAVYADQYKAARGPLGPTTPLYDKALDSRPGHDLAEVDKLLGEAGYTGRDAQGYRTKDGKRLTVLWVFNKQQVREQRDLVAQLVQEQARKAGIELRIENMSTGQWFDARDTGRFDVFDRSWVSGNPDILRSFYASYNHPAKGKVGYNASFAKDSRLDGWLEDALATGDQAERGELYAKVQQEVVDRAYLVPIYVPAAITATSTKVGGLTFDGQASPLLAGVELGK
ncbi:ABC transporter substrate-binding protein [Actinomadura hibisca]|uniref:ABC transporter substrate-binding protein n=1 Tax=Actinomadura hibisca TaxID=68565 RepID=UPI00082FDBA3|nr:ABC transporter substrate-binding protein [Actinomadura hibisca]